MLLRFGVEGDEQLRDGFPKSAGDLFAYHALIIDDLEAAFFTQDQMSLIQRFVSERGGGLIMLGGPGSFQSGKYDRTPIGELLPVYLDQALSDVPAQDYRFSLTREGQHPPWSFIRVRGTIEEEQRQLAEKPAHASLNRVRAVKPGATILARATGPDGTSYPALVAQSFGKGRTASLMAGDMWKWSMHRREDDEPDLERAWRQTMRWLVADVPQRIEIRTRRRTDLPQQPVELRVVARDEEFQPLDNAEVKIRIEPPQGAAVDLAGQPDETTAGVYVATYVPRHDGGYRATAEVLAADGSRIGERQAGWIAEPDLEEFSRLEPGRELLQQIARSTGGELVDAEALDRFVSDLPNQRIPVTEPWVFPLWHQWSVFALAMVCLVGEWGLRRLRGLP